MYILSNRKSNFMTTIEYSIVLQNGRKAYFISDLHLGLYPKNESMRREKLAVHFLDSISNDVQELFLLGDVFDFWFEYKKVVPKGFTRFMGKLAQLNDKGVNIHFFTGNHDVWAFDYLSEEIGATIYHAPVLFTINGSKFLIGHGDGLGSNDIGYSLLKFLFRCRFAQFLFARIHPNFSVWLGHAWSKNSRYSKGLAETFMGEDKEHQIKYAKKYLLSHSVDFFVFGHRHLMLNLSLNDKSRFINLGEWITLFSYGSYDGTSFSLKQYK